MRLAAQRVAGRWIGKSAGVEGKTPPRSGTQAAEWGKQIAYFPVAEAGGGTASLPSAGIKPSRCHTGKNLNLFSDDQFAHSPAPWYQPLKNHAGRRGLLRLTGGSPAQSEVSRDGRRSRIAPFGEATTRQKLIVSQNPNHLQEIPRLLPAASQAPSDRKSFSAAHGSSRKAGPSRSGEDISAIRHSVRYRTTEESPTQWGDAREKLLG